MRGAGSAAREVAFIRLLLARACSSSSSESVAVSTNGDETAGACFTCDETLESLACRAMGNLPLPFPTVTFVALAKPPFPTAGEAVGELFCSGTITFTVLGLLDRGDSEAGDEACEVLTETMRGAARTTLVAGMGTSVASSRYTSDIIDDLASDGVIDWRVYCVSRLLPDLIEEPSEYVLSLKSPGLKNSASPSLLRGLFGIELAYAAGIGGTGAVASKLLCPDPFRFVTPGIYAIWMMLLALLRMLFAIEPLVRVDAASERMALNCVVRFCCEMSSSSHSSASSSCCSLLFLIQNLHRKNMTTAMNATPPMTPPAIAPTFVLSAAGAGLGFAIHVMCEQALQSWGTREQIWPPGQSGQVGVSEGHLTHLLKMVRRFRSTS